MASAVIVVQTVATRGGDRHDRGERRPRPEQQTEAPKEEQPKDFSDSLDNMDF